MSSPEDPRAADVLEQGGELIADTSEEAREVRVFAEQMRALPEGAPVPPELIQQGLTALVRYYAVEFQLGERWPPFAEGRPMPPTAVMIMSTAMLRACNVEIFELGLWQSWSGA
jgi:hypothetical protein